jgi:hypothetical protein
MVKISSSKTFATTAEQDLFSVPGSYVAYLERLEITNSSTSPATVTFKAYNGDSSKTILIKSVAAGETIVLAGNELPTEGIPTKITVSSTSQPYSVDYSIILE